MPLIKLHVSNLWATFAFSAFVSAFIVVMAIYVKSTYDKFNVDNKDNKGNVTQSSSFKGVLITFAITFVAYMLSYAVLYFLVGYRK